MTTGDWYKDENFWRQWGHDWELREYGEHIHGKGDLIPNTCDRIVSQKDTSPQAKQSLDECEALLSEHKRWPDRMNQSIDADNWIQCKLSWLKFKLGKSDTRLYRSQNNITRDPYISFYAACAVNGEWKKIQGSKIPIHLFTPSVWSWKKYLDTGKDKYLKRCRFWNQAPTKHEYVKRLRELQEIAIQEKM